MSNELSEGRTIAVMNKRYFEKYHFSPEAVTDALDRIANRRSQILANAFTPEKRALATQFIHERQQSETEQGEIESEDTQKRRWEHGFRSAGVDLDGLTKQLNDLELARRAILLALPPHVPFVRQPLDTLPFDLLPSDPLPPLTRVPGPYSPWDDVRSTTRGTFDSLEEAPLTNAGAGIIGSKFKASALSGSLGDMGSIEYARESGVIVNYPMSGPPARLMVRIRLRLQLGWHGAVFFDRMPSAVYCHISQYHLPFVAMHFSGSSPLFAPVHVSSGEFPGLHGVEWYWSRIEGGLTEVKNPTPEQEHWNFDPLPALTAVTNDVIDPAANPEGICIVIGVRHMVHTLVDYARFEVDSGAQWLIESIEAGPV